MLDTYFAHGSNTTSTDEHSEKKIDRIEDRLSGIENVLAKLASKLGDMDLQTESTERSSQSRPSRTGSRVNSGKSPTLPTETASPAPFEGETAINSQSGYARELLAKVVGNIPSIGQNEEIKSALSALEDIVTRQGHVTVSTTSTTSSLINRALSDVDPAKLDRPPWLSVKEMLEKALGKPCNNYGPEAFVHVHRVSHYGVCSHFPVPENAQFIRDLRGCLPESSALRRSTTHASLWSGIQLVYRVFGNALVHWLRPD